MFTQNSESLRGESCADTPFGHNVQAVLTLVWGKIHVVFFPLLPCGGAGEPQASYRPLLHTNSYLVSKGGRLLVHFVLRHEKIGMAHFRVFVKYFYLPRTLDFGTKCQFQTVG